MTLRIPQSGTPEGATAHHVVDIGAGSLPYAGGKGGADRHTEQQAYAEMTNGCDQGS